MLYFTDHQNDVTNQLLFTMEHKLGSFKGKACLKSEKLRGFLEFLAHFFLIFPFHTPEKIRKLLVSGVIKGKTVKKWVNN